MNFLMETSVLKREKVKQNNIDFDGYKGLHGIGMNIYIYTVRNYKISVKTTWWV